MKYNYIHGGGEKDIESSLTDFFLDLPNFISQKNKLVPPKSVLRSVLNAGKFDSGMAGLFTWNSDSISDEALETVVLELEEKGYITCKLPPWVKNRDYWQAWKFEHLHGVPSDKHRKFIDEIKQCSERYSIAVESEISEDIDLYDIKKLQLETELSDFIASYFNR